MKYIKLFNRHKKEKDIVTICNDHSIRNYTINSDGTIDVNDDVYLEGVPFSKRISELPLKFNNVYGSFSCKDNKLTSLSGCPKYVGGHFIVAFNRLTSLSGCPKYVGGDFNCRDNKITSLIGSPSEINGYFNCSNNKLISLDGAPIRVDDYFSCADNPLPKEIKLFSPIKKIIELQNEFQIWNSDGSLNKYNFQELMKEIK